MHPHARLIHDFYTAFQALDYRAMQQCYHDDIIFNDPVFGVLRGEEAKAMWQMLCTGAKDFSLTFSDIKLLDEEYGTCRWTATYTFSKTGRRIGQAFGWKGKLLGWPGFMKRAVQKNARRSLQLFIEKNSAGNATADS